MVDPNREVNGNESIEEDLLRQDVEHAEVMERFQEDIQQTIW